MKKIVLPFVTGGCALRGDGPANRADPQAAALARGRKATPHIWLSFSTHCSPHRPEAGQKHRETQRRHFTWLQISAFRMAMTFRKVKGNKGCLMCSCQITTSLEPRWYKLHSKSGKREKERGELQVTIQFTRNNLTASMYDLSVKDKPRSTLGKLKDRVKGKKRGDAESTSAIVPRGYAALSGSGRFCDEGGGDEDVDDEEGGVARRSKVKSFFLKGKLRKTLDTRSSTSLASDGSVPSSPGGSLSPTAGISMVVSDLSNSPSNSSNLTADSSPVPTTQPSPVLMTHKRAFSDEASKVTTFLPWPRAIENLKAQSRALSRSSLCINGIHVYGGEPAVPRSVSVLQTRLGLLDKCSPLSRSLQNLTRRGEDHARAVGGGRRWSFDRSGKEEKAPLSPCPGRVEVSPEERPLVPPVAPAAKPEPADEVKKPRKNLFSQGRSESAGKGAGAARGQHGQGPACAEERHRGWFGAKDPQNKPSPEVSPKVQTSSDASSHLSPHPPDHFFSSPSPASAPSVDAPGSPCHTNPFTPAAATPPMSPSNPFFTRLQCNPFFEELIADQTLKFAPCHSSSPPWHSIASPSCPSTASPFLKNTLKEGVVSNMERPVGIVRQNSLPEQLPMAPGSAMIRSSSILSTRSMSENYAEWDDSFEAFAASRLKLPKEPVSGQLSGVSSGNRTNATPQDRPTGQIVEETAVEVVQSGNAPPLPPRRPSRVPVKDLQQDSWLDWAQELAVKKEACLLSQTDAASLQHQREQDPKRTGTHLFQRSSSETEPISTRDGNSWGSGCSPSFPSLFQKQTTETPIAQCNCSPQPTSNEASSGDRSSSETRCYSAMSTSSEDATTISTANDNAVNEVQPLKNVVDNSTVTSREDAAEIKPSVFDLPSILPETNTNALDSLLAEAPKARLDPTRCIQTHKIFEATFGELNWTDNVSVNTSKIAVIKPAANLSINSVYPANQDSGENFDGLELSSTTFTKRPCAAITGKVEVNNNLDISNLASNDMLSKRSSSSFADPVESAEFSLMSNNSRNAAKTSLESGPPVSTTALELKDYSSLFQLLPSRHQDKNFVSNTTDEHQLVRVSEEQQIFARRPSFTFSTQVSSENNLQRSTFTSDDPSSRKNMKDSASLHIHPDNIEKGQSYVIQSCGNDLKETITLTSHSLDVNQLSPLRSDLCGLGLYAADGNAFSALELGAQPPWPSEGKNGNSLVPSEADANGSPTGLSPCIITPSRDGTQVLRAPFRECARKEQEQIHPPSSPPQLSDEVLPEGHHVDKSLVVEFEDVFQGKPLYDKGAPSCGLILCSGMDQAQLYKNCHSSECADKPLGKEGKEETDSWTKELGEALGEIHFQSQGLAEQQMEAKSPTQSICSNPLTVTADIKISLNSALLKYDQQECASLGPSLSESMKEISFKDIHVSLAPDCRSHRQTDQTSELHLSSRASSASSPAADTNSQSALSPSPNLPLLSVRPSAGTTQAAAPSSTVQPLIGATHMVLPEETQLASSFLSHHESSPHPVKPLTTAAIQGEKKAEGRSVLASGLEKLKSTIHPGRTSVQSESEGSKTDSSAQYQHLSRGELVALLQQKEAELEKQKGEFEKRALLLEKREVELKKLKMQVRDLEDYIDRLLVRIMEQTPTLLQVRSRFK
uniref:Uncharacterized LOC108921083 n=2 Tax=Scleropages formosus TaxID=113540 RepID=A0A8C9V7J6_SCLFO